MKTTLTLHAYISDFTLKYLKPEELETEKVLDQLYFTRYPDLPGVVYVGQAEIEVEIFPRDQIVAGAVVMLRNQQAALRAEATAKCTALEGQVQQLLCIENKS
jgi:hypothetical protein